MMVKRGIGGPVTDAQTELLGIAYQGSRAMLELVNNLLDISKMEQGRLTLDIEPVAPYTIIDQAIDRLRVSARSKNVTLEQRIALDLPLIDADDDKIVRVLQNLIDNAIKFSLAEGRVTVGAHAFGSEHALPADVPAHPLFDTGESDQLPGFRIAPWAFPHITSVSLRSSARCAGAKCAVPGWG